MKVPGILRRIPPLDRSMCHQIGLLISYFRMTSHSMQTNWTHDWKRPYIESDIK